MLPEGTIAVSDVWKRFRSDRKGVLIRDQIRRLKARMRGTDAGWVWALRDVNFTVEPGESVGIVGANGSGKTTLLRILSGVMYPYAGKLEASGRIGALIEVRAGLHPELTGRENVYVYGTLLGLTRREVAGRFDQIVDFAELQDAIDRQLKHFSSGMQMRLGFAIAAFLDPAILMVDEILAVGDAQFQQRCLERMREVQQQGTTLLFVSHDLASVESTCPRTIWLNQGVQEADGPTADVMAAYRKQVQEFAAFAPRRKGIYEIVETEVSDGNGGFPRTQGPFEVRLVVSKKSDDGDPRASIFLGITEGTANPIFALRHEVDLGSGLAEIRCSLPRLPLPRGRFYVWASVYRNNKDSLVWHPVARFDVDGADLDPIFHSIVRLSPVHVDAKWQIEPVNGSRKTPVSSGGPEQSGR